MPTRKERVAAYKLALDSFEAASQTVVARLLVNGEPTPDELLAEKRARGRLIEARGQLLRSDSPASSRAGKRDSIGQLA